MRWISKSEEPPDLASFNQARGSAARYGVSDFPSLSVRESLKQDQGNLCAYCMRWLFEVGIEHFIAQSEAPERSTDWLNLLGVCNGRVPEHLTNSVPRSEKCCDSRRGNAPLTLNPIERSAMADISFDSGGRLLHRAAQTEIDDLLNLNHPKLVDARAKARETILKEAMKTNGATSATILDLEVARAWVLSQRSQNPLPEFFGVVEYEVLGPIVPEGASPLANEHG